MNAARPRSPALQEAPHLNRAKEAAGRRAAEFVRDGTVVGLGTGSTVAFVLERIGERLRAGEIECRGVPTSRDTEERARRLGIPLVGLDEIGRIDLTIDGADEVDPELRLIKGGGGALLREKVVAGASVREIVVVDRGKLVARLGRAFPLPVEVVPFARAFVARRIEELGARAELRAGRGGAPFVTDNGNEILDCRFADGIADPAALEARLAAIPGLVESGLFVDLVDGLVIGDDDGSTELVERPRARRGASG